VVESPGSAKASSDERRDPVRDEIEPDHPVRPLATPYEHAGNELGECTAQDPHEKPRWHHGPKFGELQPTSIRHENDRFDLVQVGQRLEVRAELVRVQGDCDQEPHDAICLLCRRADGIVSELASGREASRLAGELQL
jgi:hypothetical protein